MTGKATPVLGENRHAIWTIWRSATPKYELRHRHVAPVGGNTDSELTARRWLTGRTLQTKIDTSKGLRRQSQRQSKCALPASAKCLWGWSILRG